MVPDKNINHSIFLWKQTTKEMAKVKTRSQLADEYGICRKTLYNWLTSKKIIVSRGHLTPHDQKTIYDEFGPPRKIE